MAPSKDAKSGNMKPPQRRATRTSVNGGHMAPDEDDEESSTTDYNGPIDPRQWEGTASKVREFLKMHYLRTRGPEKAESWLYGANEHGMQPTALPFTPHTSSLPSPDQTANISGGIKTSRQASTTPTSTPPTPRSTPKTSSTRLSILTLTRSSSSCAFATCVCATRRPSASAMGPSPRAQAKMNAAIEPTCASSSTGCGIRRRWNA